MEQETRPAAHVTGKRHTYTLYANGELWFDAGNDSYRAGYLMDPCAENRDDAIVEWEEEARCLKEDARAAFGSDL